MNSDSYMDQSERDMANVSTIKITFCLITYCRYLYINIVLFTLRCIIRHQVLNYIAVFYYTLFTPTICAREDTRVRSRI